MMKIESISDLSRLITEQWKPGVLTNAAFSAEAFQNEIDAGTLYAVELSGGLLLLRRREGYDRLNFYLQPSTGLEDWVPQRTTVLEIPARDRDQGLRAMGPVWEQAGFELKRSRLRIGCRRKEVPAGAATEIQIRNARTEDQSWIMDLMYRIYEPMTSCIPTQAELAADIAEENVVCAQTPDGEPAGFLHMSRTKRSTECRHLAVEPRMRRRGIAGAMFAFDWARARTPLYQIWVDQDNFPALRLYEKLGYSPDGWESTVWICKKGTDNNERKTAADSE